MLSLSIVDLYWCHHQVPNLNLLPIDVNYDEEYKHMEYKHMESDYSEEGEYSGNSECSGEVESDYLFTTSCDEASDCSGYDESSY